HRPDDPNAEPQRLTLYIPAGLLDLADALSRRAGAETVQIYCEELLMEAIQARARQEKLDEAAARHGPFEGRGAVAHDPEHLAAWTASSGRAAEPTPTEVTDGPTALAIVALDPPKPSTSPAAELVLRHAGLGEPDPTGFLATLRRGEPIGAE